MLDPRPHPSDLPVETRVRQLEQRVARLEERLAGPTEAGVPGTPAPSAGRPPGEAPGDEAPAGDGIGPGDEALELELGQNWFARAGSLALAAGGVFLLTLPHAGLPPAAPACAGYVVAAALFAVAHRWQQRFELVANYGRGAAMALLWFSTLRLFFFGPPPALDPGSPAAPALLFGVVALDLAIAFRRRSPRLVTLALAMGYTTGVAVGTAWSVGFVVVALPLVLALSAQRMRWSLPVLAAPVLGGATYLIWAAGNPLRGGAFHFAAAPAFAPSLLLASVAALALVAHRRAAIAPDAAFAGASAALNCGVGYGVFLMHTAAVFRGQFIPAHGAASLLFLGLAVLFWVRQQCLASTFLYAMTGYAALSLAIIKATSVPDVFVWLSAESLVVIATAVWFRSRFIVVANFLIFVAIVLGYVVLKNRETGISVGIGVVALVSARILNWQKHRLGLKTELMRNAYLISAFVIFPYALYHLVPGGYVGLAWVGLALSYYALNLVVRSPKYRWMGHATLLLTTVYLAVVGTRQFDPVYRIVSFLALGAALLIVSLTFSRLRSRRDDKPRVHDSAPSE